MGTISVNQLQKALQKAQNIGIVEESFILDGCEITFRNLRPEEYAAVVQECDGLEDLAYIASYQKGHIARAIIELNGVDLRGVDYVDVDETDKAGNAKKVKLELYRYLLDNLIDSWGKEAVYTAYRKFSDVVELAERKANSNISFLLEEETEEEKYRRLLLEAKAVESGIPSTVVESILRDLGMSQVATAAELKKVSEDLSTLEPEPTPAPIERPRDVPADPHVTLQQAIAARKPPVEPPVVEPVAQSRAEAIAHIEAVGQEIAEVRKHIPVDPRAAASIIDQPPVAGINPRFRPQSKVR